MWETIYRIIALWGHFIHVGYIFDLFAKLTNIDNNKSFPSPTKLTTNATYNAEAEQEYKLHKTGKLIAKVAISANTRHQVLGLQARPMVLHFLRCRLSVIIPEVYLLALRVKIQSSTSFQALILQSLQATHYRRNLLFKD